MATPLTADAFLADATAFQLGELPTEASHPATADLSRLAKTDLPAAIRTVGDVDRQALSSLRGHLPELASLAAEIAATVRAGHRVFLCGCGATGRMALALESIWRHATRGATRRNAVRAFMAGGDLGLIHSVEDFEDRPDFGAAMLEEAGFRRNDLLIACTEGGETPFVIGAVERAAAVSRRKPFFLYCNPEDLLRARVERSRRVLENPAIRSLSLFVGPMALAGSTRMQATTMLMLAVGHALLARGSMARLRQGIRQASTLADADFGFLAPFIAAEHRICESGELLSYESRRYALTVLTDTTERSPTFSLRPFENVLDRDPHPALSFLSVTGAATSAAAWRAMLGRAPRPLRWPQYAAIAGAARLRGFDLSGHGLAFRRSLAPASRHHVFRIERQGPWLALALDGLRHRERLRARHHGLLNEQVFVKLLLNTHSLLVMGRLGRYEGNLMTWVKPSNRKLIDRAVRYVRLLLEARGHTPVPSYDATARVLLSLVSRLHTEQSIVLSTVAAFERKAASPPAARPRRSLG